MNKLEIENLSQIMHAGYDHICLNPSDLGQFRNIPWEDKHFYTVRDRTFYDKRGFFKNTMVWVDHTIPVGYMKVADKPLTSYTKPTWSDNLSFSEENSPKRISKIMKLKAFW